MAEITSTDVAVVGSPSTNTHLTVDLLQEAIEDRLVGALVSFEASQSSARITTVGQIVGIELKNRWHEDSVFRNLIKRTGEIPPITSRQDTRTAELAVGATFRRVGSEGFDPDVLGMVPPTGTRVARVDQALLDRLLAVYRKELFYLGRAYANDVLYPMWFKHFGSGGRGAGEAYHFGVFGKTGSGKSGLAKMLLLAYARHPELGMLIIDPQGEFAFELSGRRVGEQGLPVDSVLERLDRSVSVYTIGQIQLEGWDLFEELFLARKFVYDILGIRGADHQRLAGELLVEDLRGRKLSELGDDQGLRAALTSIHGRAAQIYPSNRATVLQQRIGDLLANQNGELNEVLRMQWTPLCALFESASGKRKLYGIVDDIMRTEGGSRPIVAIDISEQSNPGIWTEELQKRILARLLGAISARASKTLGQSANVLVVLDEAHRHAPSGSLDSGSQAEVLRTTLRRAVRETRKFGVGWFMISQTLGGIDSELVKQLRILFFGFGLAMGDEFRKLGEFAGGDKRSMELYQSFRDPHSAPRPDLREFPWMAVGPVSPLSHSGKPVFFSAFTDPAEFLDSNGLNSSANDQIVLRP
jgi:hypothetical protein